MLEGRLGAFMLDDLFTFGRPSRIRTTFLDLGDTMDKLKIAQFFIHHQHKYIFLLKIVDNSFLYSEHYYIFNKNG